MYVKSNNETAKDFTLVEATLEFPGEQQTYDLRNVITDIDIFEHIDKPYLTGNLLMVDAQNLYSRPGFVGIEKLTLRLSLAYDDAPVIEKVFYVDKVLKNVRTSDYNTVLSLHLIEEIGYLSEFINVNKPYQGKLYDIVGEMFEEYFSKQVVAGAQTNVADRDAQKPTKIIVPNLPPLQAADWVKERMTTPGGLPFYLFSTLVSNDIYLISLAKMLDQPAINGRPFTYSRAFSNLPNLTPDQQALIIEAYTEHPQVEIVKLNAYGFVNSRYNFHDITSGVTTQAGNQNPDLRRWTAYSMFDPQSPFADEFGSTKTKNALYPVDAKLPEVVGGESVEIHERPESSNTTFVHTSNIWGSIEGWSHLGEANNRTRYRQMIDSKAHRRWILNRPMDIRVPGYWFLIGESHNTIGNKLRLTFLVTRGESPERDERKSGDYLIYAARHQFTREGYDVVLTGTKVRETDDRQSFASTFSGT